MPNSQQHTGYMKDRRATFRRAGGATAAFLAGVLTINHFGLLVAATTAPPRYVFRMDADNDGDVDGNDFGDFAACFNKAGNPPRCEYGEAVMFDADADGDVDNADFFVFLECFNKTGRPYKNDWCMDEANRKYQVSGSVTDPEGNPLSGVKVVLLPPQP